MSLFNKTTKQRERTINQAGGMAFKQSPKLELASILITSFAQDQFYRSASATFNDLIKLLPQVEPVFAAKAAIFARQEFGMRSITHVLAAELAGHVSGQVWAKEFYTNIVKRPDDMLEILAYFFEKGGGTIPNAMKKGFAKAFNKFDGYQLAKYRGESKAVKLVDVVNLVHPVATARNANALRDLVNGNLKSTTTWESKLTDAGKKAESKEDKDALKAKVWKELITENKLGYFALLRNLRNIAEQSSDMIDDAIVQLTDKNRIRKSMVFPFRFLIAMEALKDAKLSVRIERKLTKALNQALELSLVNVPKFEGSTLIVLDDSGSMTWGRSTFGKQPIEIGAIFAAMLFKTNEADLMRFSDKASYVKMYHEDGAISIAERLVKKATAAGTNFHSIFQTANKAYDRIVILSDMQGWIGHDSPEKAFASYKQTFGADPFIYSFDLQGLGSMQFPERNVFALGGFSDKVFDIMKNLEADRNALISRIEQVEFA